MLTEICGYLHNWFCEDEDIVVGTIVVGDSEITVPYGVIQPGQYIRIVGSVFNDGVWKYGEAEFTPEEYEGALYLMKVPKKVIDIAQEMSEWQSKYGGVNSKSMSPFNSESFAGYSYSKSAGGGFGEGQADPNSVFSVYGARLAQWRKL